MALMGGVLAVMGAQMRVLGLVLEWRVGKEKAPWRRLES